MAGAQIEFLMTPFVDANGDPLEGGTVEFYIAGTSTSVDVYADKDLVTNLGNSVTLDSRGIKFCFADGDNFLKIIVKDSDDVTLYTYDGLSYRGGLTDANLYYLLDGSNALTGNMNVNGWDLNNTGDITVGTSKRLIVDHGGTYSPVGADMIVLQDPSAIYRMYTLSGALNIYKSGSKLAEITSSAFKSLVDFEITGSLTVSSGGSFGGDVAMAGNKLTGLTAGTVTGDSVEYDQLNSAISTGTIPIQSELDTTQTGAGLNTDGTYTPDPTADYISGATSLKNADSLLDDQVKANADELVSQDGRLDAIEALSGEDNPYNTNLSDVALEQGSTNWEQAIGSGDNTLPTSLGFNDKVSILYDLLVKNNIVAKSSIYICENDGTLQGGFTRNTSTNNYPVVVSNDSDVAFGIPSGKAMALSNESGAKITNLHTASITEALDAANKEYVDTYTPGNRKVFATSGIIGLNPTTWTDVCIFNIIGAGVPTIPYRFNIFFSFYLADNVPGIFVAQRKGDTPTWEMGGQAQTTANSSSTSVNLGGLELRALVTDDNNIKIQAKHSASTSLSAGLGTLTLDRLQDGIS